MLKKINKKGIADKFFTLVIVVMAIAIILFILYIIISGNMKKKQMQTEIDLNVMDGLYTSRVVLNQEIEDDKKVFAFVVDAVNKNDYTEFNLALTKALSNYYEDNKIQNKWLIVINEKVFVIDANGNVAPLNDANVKKQIIDGMPKITIPNPDGKNIMFLAKPSSNLDSQNTRVYGYRAGLLKGYTPTVGSNVAPDGTPLQKIENIPNVICDESDTTVGKICSAKPELIMQLKKLSAEELQPKGEKLVITQAFRSYEIQKNLYEQTCIKYKDKNDDACNCIKNNDCEYARNPDKLVNPSGHLDGTAIDAIIYTKSGKKLNGEGGVDPALAEDIMCSYGFVRWKKESWHFEYGSTQWIIAEKARESGKKVCSYGSG